MSLQIEKWSPEHRTINCASGTSLPSPPSEPSGLPSTLRPSHLSSWTTSEDLACSTWKGRPRLALGGPPARPAHPAAERLSAPCSFQSGVFVVPRGRCSDLGLGSFCSVFRRAASVPTQSLSPRFPLPLRAFRDHSRSEPRASVHLPGRSPLQARRRSGSFSHPGPVPWALGKHAGSNQGLCNSKNLKAKLMITDCFRPSHFNSVAES